MYFRCILLCFATHLLVDSLIQDGTQPGARSPGGPGEGLGKAGKKGKKYVTLGQIEFTDSDIPNVAKPVYYKHAQRSTKNGTMTRIWFFDPQSLSYTFIVPGELPAADQDMMGWIRENVKLYSRIVLDYVKPGSIVPTE